MPTVSLEIIGDFICPWCYLGKARLSRVLQELITEIKVKVLVRPYMLYPQIPPGGLPKSDFARRTKPGMGRSLRYEAGVEKININYKNIERVPSSLEAHRLVWLTSDADQKWQLSQHIFHDYFEYGQDIEDQDYLIGLAKKVGVPRVEWGQFLDENAARQAVLDYVSSQKEEFVTIVPSIRLSQQIVLPGLQPAEVWEKYIRRAAVRQLNID